MRCTSTQLSLLVFKFYLNLSGFTNRSKINGDVSGFLCSCSPLIVTSDEHQISEVFNYTNKDHRENNLIEWVTILWHKYARTLTQFEMTHKICLKKLKLIYFDIPGYLSV